MRAMKLNGRISPLSEIDAYLHLYYSVDFHPLQCINYDEDSFPKLIGKLEKKLGVFYHVT